MDSRIFILFAVIVLILSYFVLTTNFQVDSYAQYSTSVNACYMINKTGYSPINVYVSDQIDGISGISYEGAFIMMGNSSPFIIIKTHLMNESWNLNVLLKHEFCHYTQWSENQIERSYGTVPSEGNCYDGGTIDVTKQDLVKISCSTTPFAKYYKPY